MKHIIYSVALFLVSCAIAAGQAESTLLTKPSSQITLQGSGLFARSTTDSGVTYKPSITEGISAGYRFYIFRWLGVEGDYDYFSHDIQKYSLSNTSVSLKSNLNAVTGAAVINIPNPMTKKLQSFALVGGGAMIFRPSESFIDYQTTNVIVFGGGMDFPVTRHIAIRAQAKTFLYKAPDFQNMDLKVDKFTQAMVPSAGLVYKF
jgi:hypothetical protein